MDDNDNDGDGDGDGDGDDNEIEKTITSLQLVCSATVSSLLALEITLSGLPCE